MKQKWSIFKKETGFVGPCVVWSLLGATGKKKEKQNVPTRFKCVCTFGNPKWKKAWKNHPEKLAKINENETKR